MDQINIPRLKLGERYHLHGNEVANMISRVKTWRGLEAQRPLRTCRHGQVGNGELHLVLSRNLLPRGQEDALVHHTVLAEEDVRRHQAGEVEDVDVVLNGHLASRSGGRGE